MVSMRRTSLPGWIFALCVALHGSACGVEAPESLAARVTKQPPTFKKGEKIEVEVSLVNSPREVRGEIRCSVQTLDRKLVHETTVPLRGKARETLKGEFAVENLPEGLYRIVCVASSGLVASCWAGVLTGKENERRIAFDELPAQLKERLAVGRMKTAQEIDSPFGIYAHNELPMLEAVRVASDYGAGDARFPQYPQIPVTDALLKYGVEPVFHLDGSEKEVREVVRSLKGKVKYYRFGGDEPNNRGTPPRDYIETLKPYSKIVREEDPQARIMGADLGDEGTGAYWKACIDEHILDYVDLNPYGYFLWGNGLGLFLYMENLRAYAQRNYKKSFENYLSPLISFGQPPSIGQGNRMIRHFIEVYWRGVRMVNLYKLIDNIEPFGLLHYEGTTSAPYVMLQNLCSVLNCSVKPADHPAIEPLSPIAQFNYRAFDNERLALLLFYEGDGERVGLPNYPGKPTDFVVSESGFAAPCEFDLLTGEVRSLAYSECGSKTVVQDCIVRPYPKALLLFKPTEEFVAQHIRRPADSRWRHLSTRDALPNDWVTALAVDENADELWVGTYNSGGRHGGQSKFLSRVQLADFTSEHFGPEGGWIDQTPSKIVVTDQAVWVGTRAAGLGCYDRTAAKWKLFSSVEDESWGTLDFVDLAIGHGAIWTANLCGGVGRLDLGTFHWTTYTETRYNELTGGTPVTDPHDFARANRVVTVLVEGPCVYAGTLSNGLSCLDLRTGRWSRILEGGKLASGAVWTAKADGAKLWLAGTGGVACYDTKDQSSKTYLFPADKPIAGQRVVHLGFDGAGGVWCGTYYTGLARLDPASGKFALFEPSPEGLPDARLTALLPRGDQVWLGYWGAGAAVLETASGRVRRITTRNGLGDDRVWTITADEASVYFGTYRGLSILRTAPLRLVREGGTPTAGKTAAFTLSAINLTDQALANLKLDVAAGPGFEVALDPLPAPADLAPGGEWKARFKVAIPTTFRDRNFTISSTLRGTRPDGKEETLELQRSLACNPPVYLDSHTALPTITNVDSRLVELRIGWGLAEAGKCTVRLKCPDSITVSPEARELGFHADGEKQFCSFELKLREGTKAPRGESELAVEADTPVGKLELARLEANTDYLDSWMLIGPFCSAEAAPGIEEKKKLPPESEIDFTKSYPTGKKRVAWRKWYKSAAVADYDFDSLMGTKKPGENRESVVFICTKIHSEEERDVDLKLTIPQYQSASGKTQPAVDVAIWLNGERVVGKAEGPGTLTEMADINRADEASEEPTTDTQDQPHLKKGQNLILIKCQKHSEPWRFSLEFLVPRTTKPVPGLRFEP